ncbi:MAG: glycosyltransferase family 4 protein, partial [Acidobacteriota bacterium]|nr:glycosyltransferase family 4 protein [Acidobacteriota bacterium]
MRILQISSAQSLGGGERHLADLANGLAQRGHGVYAALRPKSPLREELSNLPKENLITLPLRNSLDAGSARDLARVVRQHRIEIVHAHMARDYPLAAFAVRRNPDAKLIVTRHVLFPLNRLHRITLAKASRIIAVSQAVASQLRADQIAPHEKVTVVLNGIDTRRFQKARTAFDREQFLRDWKLPNDRLVVGTVGELTPLKGHVEFIKAAARILEHHPNAHFIIAGTDSSREKKHHQDLSQLIEQLDLGQRMTILPWLEDVAQLYCALDIFVSASHTESFGLAIVEAMATGAAVVATSTEGAQEIIRRDETGLLVPISDVQSLADAVSGLL